MIYARGRQPAVDQATHSVPTEVALLAAAQERPVPELAYPKRNRFSAAAFMGTP